MSVKYATRLVLRGQGTSESAQMLGTRKKDTSQKAVRNVKTQVCVERCLLSLRTYFALSITTEYTSIRDVKVSNTLITREERLP